jgi:cell division protein FtsW
MTKPAEPRSADRRTADRRSTGQTRSVGQTRSTERNRPTERTRTERARTERTRPTEQKRAELRLVPAPETPATSSPGSKSRIGRQRADRARDGRRLVLLTAALSCFGLVVVLSASSVASITADGSPWSLFEKQVLWTLIGVVVFVPASRIELATVRRFAVPFALATTILLLVVLAPGIGQITSGSSRWLGAGPIRIQPSELAKLAFAIFAADLVARRYDRRDQRRAIVYPLLGALVVMAMLIVRQPDMGTAVVLCLIGVAVLVGGGIECGILLRIFVVFAAAGAIVALAVPYRRARLLSFLNPFAHASTTGYQVAQSLTTLGSGHLTGTGLGGSPAKWGFLPNAWTDFVFAIIGNELGLIGSLVVLVAFGLFAWLGLRIAARTPDRFAGLLATGITCWIVAQALINIGGVVDVIPETGIPLPFLSSGGASLVVVFAAVGLLVNIARHDAPTATAAHHPTVRRVSPPRSMPQQRRATAKPRPAPRRLEEAR